MNDLLSHIDVWYELYTFYMLPIYFSILIIFSRYKLSKKEIISYVIYSFAGMAKRFTAEEAVT